MKLTKKILLRNLDTVGYCIAVIHYGILSQDQTKDKAPYMTLTQKTPKELKALLGKFCDDHIGHNFSILLKNAASSHGHGVNFCQVELIEDAEPLETETVAPTFQVPLQGFRKSEADIRKEITQEFLLKDLQRQIESLSKDSKVEPDTKNQMAVVGVEILKQLTSTGEPETSAEFLTLLNTISGGALESEVKALNGIPDTSKPSDEDIKTIVDMFGAQMIKDLAKSIKDGKMTKEKITMLKSFLT